MSKNFNLASIIIVDLNCGRFAYESQRGLRPFRPATYEIVPPTCMSELYNIVFNSTFSITAI